MAQAKDCPKCGSPMILRNGRNGKFWGCSNYPECRKTLNYREEVVVGNGEVAVPEKSVTLSSYQEAVLDGVKDTDGNDMVVEAVAGSGKTFILVRSLQHTSGNTVFCAFNKKIAQTLAQKAPDHVQCSTLHSIGFGVLQSNDAGQTVDNKKKYNIAQELLPDQRDRHVRSGMVRLASLIQATMTDAEDEAEVRELMSRYEIDFAPGNDGTSDDQAKAVIEAEEKAVKTVPTLLALDADRIKTIDFDDMIWLPLFHNMSFGGYDWIFVDECQDLNAANIEQVKRMAVDNGSRVVAVGDRNQSIYGFRGADIMAMPRLVSELHKTATLPLSITYRCPRSHVRLAQVLVPHIEAAPWAEEGTVRECVMMHEVVEELQDEDLVMCRVNAPLAGLCYKLIRAGKKATIAGRDIGQGLIDLIGRLRPSTMDELYVKLAVWRDAEVAKFEKLDRQGSITLVNDKFETIVALSEGCTSVSDLTTRILSIFQDNVSGIVLSSVHRAKGMEADNTYILKPELLPHPKGDPQQEMNILYVAVTRAKKQLSFIGEMPEVLRGSNAF